MLQRILQKALNLVLFSRKGKETERERHREKPQCLNKITVEYGTKKWYKFILNCKQMCLCVLQKSINQFKPKFIGKKISASFVQNTKRPKRTQSKYGKRSRSRQRERERVERLGVSIFYYRKLKNVCSETTPVNRSDHTKPRTDRPGEWMYRMKRSVK